MVKKTVYLGDVPVGGTHPVSIQTMCTTPTRDSRSTLDQIEEVAEAGCDIIRVALPDRHSIPAFRRIASRSLLPVVADIHFLPALAVEAIDAGARGIRLNPGTIGDKGRISEILRLAARKSVPIRIGINSGSVERKHRQAAGSLPEAMVNSALEHISFFEDHHFNQIKISLKASSVSDTVQAYRMMDKACDYPLHLGVTEAGPLLQGSIKSAIGIGALLLDGIGDTIRVSLTDDPVKEIRVAKEILSATGRLDRGFDLISCPTCARTAIDLITIVNRVDRELQLIKARKRVKVAVMGCEVNGPGEARDADVGLAFSRRRGHLFMKGKRIETVPVAEATGRLIELVKQLNNEQ